MPDGEHHFLHQIIAVVTLGETVDDAVENGDVVGHPSLKAFMLLLDVHCCFHGIRSSSATFLTGDLSDTAAKRMKGEVLVAIVFEFWGMDPMDICLAGDLHSLARTRRLQTGMKTILWVVLGFLAFAAITPAEAARLPVVTVSAADGTAVEGSDDAAMFVVRRSGGVQNPLRVFYLVGGNARNGLDYEIIERSVVIPAGSPEVTIEVVPLDDELLESTEFVAVHLKPAPRRGRKYRVGAAQRAAVQIVDNDQPLDAPLPRIWLGLQSPERETDLVPNFRAPAQITILVMDGSPYTIDTVEIFANDESLVLLENPNPGRRFVNPRDPLDSARFKFAWSNVSAGIYALGARGITTDGRQVFADPITVTVQP